MATPGRGATSAEAGAPSNARTIEQMENFALENQLSLWSAIGRMLDEHALPTRAEAALAAFQRMMSELASELSSTGP